MIHTVEKKKKNPPCNTVIQLSTGDVLCILGSVTKPDIKPKHCDQLDEQVWASMHDLPYELCMQQGGAQCSAEAQCLCCHSPV